MKPFFHTLQFLFSGMSVHRVLQGFKLKYKRQGHIPRKGMVYVHKSLVMKYAD